MKYIEDILGMSDRKFKETKQVVSDLFNSKTELSLRIPFTSQSEM